MSTAAAPIDPSLLRNTARIARRAVVRVMLALLAVAGAAAAIGLPNRGAPWMTEGIKAGLILVGLPAGIFGIVLPIAVLYLSSDARRIDAFIEAFSRGRYLVCWRYAPESWRRFRDVQSPAERRRMRLLAGMLLAAAAGVPALWLVLRRGAPPAASATGQTVAAILVWTMAGGLLAGAGLAVWLHRRRQRRLALPQPTILTTLGAYANGHWIIWGAAGSRFDSMTVEEERDDQPLMLCIARYSGDNLMREQVLVPDGQAELARKAAQLISESPLREASAQDRAAGALGRALEAAYDLARLLR